MTCHIHFLAWCDVYTVLSEYVRTLTNPIITKILSAIWQVPACNKQLTTSAHKHFSKMPISKIPTFSWHIQRRLTCEIIFF